MRSETGLLYLVQTLVWIGGDTAWPADVIAEQLGDFDDPRVHADLQRAVEAGLVWQDSSGYRLADDGWALAASAVSGR
jgi:hypothetical protein